MVDVRDDVVPCGLAPYCNKVFRGGDGEFIGQLKVISPEDHSN